MLHKANVTRDLAATTIQRDQLDCHITYVRAAFPAGEKAAQKSRKALEDGIKREIEKAQKWITARSARVNDASAQLSSYNLNNLADEPKQAPPS